MDCPHSSHLYSPYRCGYPMCIGETCFMFPKKEKEPDLTNIPTEKLLDELRRRFV
jgi:hypothetical protein